MRRESTKTESKSREVVPRLTIPQEICKRVSGLWAAGEVGEAWELIGDLCGADWVGRIASEVDLGPRHQSKRIDFPSERPRLIRAHIDRCSETNKEDEALDRSIETMRALTREKIGDDAIQWLVAAARQILEDLEGPRRPLRVAILGEFSSGKSRLINALIGSKILPVGRVPVTRSVTRLVHAHEYSVTAHYVGGAIREVGFEDLAKLTDERRREVSEPELEQVVVGYPAEFLESVELLDTPGFNSDNEIHDQVATQLLLEADAVLWILAPYQVGSRSELSLLDTVRRAQGKVVAVLNQIDTLGGASEIEQQVSAARRHYSDCVVEVVPTSAKWMELNPDNPDANRESVLSLIQEIGSWSQDQRDHRMARRAFAVASQVRALFELRASEARSIEDFLRQHQEALNRSLSDALVLWEEALVHRGEVHAVSAGGTDRWFEPCARERPLGQVYAELAKKESLDHSDVRQLLECLRVLEEVHWHVASATPWREDFLICVRRANELDAAIEPPALLLLEPPTLACQCPKQVLESLLGLDPISERNVVGEARRWSLPVRWAGMQNGFWNLQACHARTRFEDHVARYRKQWSSRCEDFFSSWDGEGFVGRSLRVPSKLPRWLLKDWQVAKQSVETLSIVVASQRHRADQLTELLDRVEVRSSVEDANAEELRSSLDEVCRIPPTTLDLTQDRELRETLRFADSADGVELYEEQVETRDYRVRERVCASLTALVIFVPVFGISAWIAFGGLVSPRVQWITLGGVGAVFFVSLLLWWLRDQLSALVLGLAKRRAGSNSDEAIYVALVNDKEACLGLAGVYDSQIALLESIECDRRSVELAIDELETSQEEGLSLLQEHVERGELLDTEKLDGQGLLNRGDLDDVMSRLQENYAVMKERRISADNGVEES